MSPPAGGSCIGSPGSLRVACLGALCLSLAVVPGDGVAQEAGDTVVVQVRVVSEGGSSAGGVVLRIKDLGDRLADAQGLALETDTVSLRLLVGRSYRIEAEAPGHRGRSADLSPTEPATLRFVLPVDPYELPVIAAVGEERADSRARTVYQARFADESSIYATVSEWLLDVPGATVHGRGPGGAQALTVRGSRPEDVLVLLDGIPLNDPLTGRANLAMFPTSTLETGTLVQGAASQRYGSGAGAGVLLLTSRAGRGSGLSGGVRMESFGGMGLDLRADASGDRGRMALSLSAAKAENDFTFSGASGASDALAVRTNADVSSLHASLHASSGPVFGSVRLDRSERGVPARAGTSEFADARAEDRSLIVAAGLELANVRGSTSFGRHRLEYRTASQDAASTQRVGEFRVSGDVNVPSTPLTVGARLTREVVSGDAIAGDPERTTVGARVAAGLAAGPLRVDPGLAVDIVGGRVVASPEVAGTWLAGRRTRVWGRVGTGFRLPTFGDLYFASQYQLRANPDLEAERITLDSEIGVSVRTDLGAMGLETSASSWMRRTEDPIVWLASSVALWSPRNLGELRARGLDVQVELVSRDRARVGWRVQMVGSVQRSRVGFGSNRNPLPYEPGSTGRASLEGWSGATGLRVDFRYTGPRSTSLAATRTLGGFTTVDLSARHRLETANFRFGLFARIENVMDRRYQWVELYPEPGRHFTLRIEARRAAQ